MTELSRGTHKAKKQHICNFCGGIIEIGEVYEVQNISDFGRFYMWKSHISCNKIANKLDMFDLCDDGVTENDFKEYIQEEYRNILSDHYNDIYESKDFVYPIFEEQLSFVKSHYKII